MDIDIPTTYLEPAKIYHADMVQHGTCLDCKSILNIGIFFDGTNNSIYTDKGGDGQTNVARLYDLYRDDPFNGFYKYYIQGVGTEFRDVGEIGKSTLGSSFAAGGEARVIWGLLQVLNAIHSFVNDTRPMLSREEAGLLASSRPNSNQDSSAGDRRLFDAINQRLGTNLRFGLNGNWNNIRSKFLMKCFGILKMKLAHRDTVPNISGIYLDVFGFSRGAAQARVFCNWLHQSLIHDGELCGVPAYVRMLGLFDTVASVGWNQTGHHSWASAEDLRIHPEIKTCLHYVALHEFRNNFPLDSVCVDGVLPPNCCEQIAPGAHSDVGGGYEPGEQGKGVRIVVPDSNFPSNNYAEPDNRYRLSQLPLNLMLEVTKKICSRHGVDGNPWLDFSSTDKTELQKLQDDELPQQFACHPDVRTHVEDYFARCEIDPSPVDEATQKHLKLYLAWRYSMTKTDDDFSQSTSVRYARFTDKQRVAYYMAGQRIFTDQIRLNGIGGGYHDKAPKILKEIMALPVPGVISRFFDKYVHDSYAGFIGQFGGGTLGNMAHIVAEPRRYLCYRYMYWGDDNRLNAQLEPGQKYA